MGELGTAGLEGSNLGCATISRSTWCASTSEGTVTPESYQFEGTLADLDWQSVQHPRQKQIAAQ